MADTLRFDPDEELTLSELTQVLRELHHDVSSAVLPYLERFAPTFHRHLKVNGPDDVRPATWSAADVAAADNAPSDIVDP